MGHIDLYNKGETGSGFYLTDTVWLLNLTIS